MAKKTTKKKTTKTKGFKKGSKLVCGFCGLELTVDESCSCVDVCDLICCGDHLQPQN